MCSIPRRIGAGGAGARGAHLEERPRPRVGSDGLAEALNVDLAAVCHRRGLAADDGIWNLVLLVVAVLRLVAALQPPLAAKEVSKVKVGVVPRDVYEALSGVRGGRGWGCAFFHGGGGHAFPSNDAYLATGVVAPQGAWVFLGRLRDVVVPVGPVNVT